METSKRGDGIARVKGFVIFVPNTKPGGDKVKVKITRVGRSYAVAEVTQEEPSLRRNRQRALRKWELKGLKKNLRNNGGALPSIDNLKIIRVVFFRALTEVPSILRI